MVQVSRDSTGQHEVEEQAQPPYQWESRPKRTSWVYKLRSSQAKDQCLAWHIAPAATMDANRTLLKDFINHKVKRLLGPIHNKSQEMQELEDEARTTPNLKEGQKNIATEDQWSYLVKTTAAAVGMEVAAALGDARSRPISRNDNSNFKFTQDFG
ncbi:hypothetical protein J6590_047792 [Homalodisca vitripennis]|nr:hypothetical protein J6590_047792 [Homalodisca vitripennis]